MSELTENIRRQRKEIDDSLESTSSNQGVTTQLLDKINELRQRQEKSQEAFAKMKRDEK